MRPIFTLRWVPASYWACGRRWRQGSRSKRSHLSSADAADGRPYGRWRRPALLRRRPPPSVHGIAANHYLAPDGHEVQLTDPSFLRAPTIHAALHARGAKVLAVSA